MLASNSQGEGGFGRPSGLSSSIALSLTQTLTFSTLSCEAADVLDAVFGDRMAFLILSMVSDEGSKLVLMDASSDPC